MNGHEDSRLMWKGLMWEGDVVGLYYMRGRWYDPELGRFIQEDPIHSGVNDYAFAGNDPVNGSDPSGLDDAGMEFICTQVAEGDVRCIQNGTLGAVVVTAPAPAGPGNYGGNSFGAPEGSGLGGLGSGSGTSNSGQPKPNPLHRPSSCRLRLSPLAVEAGQDAYRRTVASYSEQGNVIIQGRITPIVVVETGPGSAKFGIPMDRGISLLSHGHLRYGPYDKVYGHASHDDVIAAEQIHAPVLAYSVDSVSVAFPNGRVFTCYHP